MAPVPLPAWRRPVARVFAVEHVRVGAHLAVETDQRVVGKLLAALARHQHLALGHHRGGEIEHHRRLAGPRHADAERRRRYAALGAAEGRHQHAARGIDEMHRDEPGLGRHLGPVADPADVACVPERHHGEAHGLALLDADGDGLRRHGLAETMQAIDHRQHRRLVDHLHLAVGVHDAVALPLQVARHARDAVAVVTGQIGGDQVLADALRLRGRAPGLGEGIAHQLGKRPRFDRHHLRRIPLPRPSVMPRPCGSLEQHRAQVMGAVHANPAGQGIRPQQT